MASPSVAALLGRPDLASNFNVATVTPAGTSYSQGGRMQPAVGPAASYSAGVSGDVSLGQTSLGIVAAMIVGLGLFYVWTRGRQA